MKIFQTPTFKKQIKKLHANQKKDLDKAIKSIIENPPIGQIKKGSLDGIWVYKFKITKQPVLLAYEFCDKKMELVMLVFGSHENFYRDLVS